MNQQEEMQPVAYLCRVPDHISISGLDRDRWLLIMPAWQDNPAEGAPVTARHAAELFADGDYEIGRAWAYDVRRDLEQLAAQELRMGAQSVGTLAAAVDRTA